MHLPPWVATPPALAGVHSFFKFGRSRGTESPRSHLPLIVYAVWFVAVSVVLRRVIPAESLDHVEEAV